MRYILNKPVFRRMAAEEAVFTAILLYVFTVYIRKNWDLG